MTVVTHDAVVAEKVSFAYNGRPTIVGVDLAIRSGERVALTGPSGSGKSTLLHLLAGILAPHSGTISLWGERLDSLESDARAELRLTRMGFVFQFAELLPELSIVENVELPARLLGTPSKEARQRATELLERLGIGDVATQAPGRVSGGQRQRGAIARALVHHPAIVYADEPTGALDEESGTLALDLLLSVSHEEGASLVVVTHNSRVADRLDRVVALRDGRLVA